MLNKVLISFILLTFIFSTCKSETETKTEKGLQIESNAKGKSQRDGKGDYHKDWDYRSQSFTSLIAYICFLFLHLGPDHLESKI